VLKARADARAFAQVRICQIPRAAERGGEAVTDLLATARGLELVDVRPGWCAAADGTRSSLDHDGSVGPSQTPTSPYRAHARVREERCALTARLPELPS
jgi:hypothetical protein